MDGDSAADLRRDEEISGTAEDASTAGARGILKDTHTCLPGFVQSFDPLTQTAVVQPAIQRIFVGKGAVALPTCLDVPVQFPRGGNFVLTFPVAAGDECLLVFSERAIDFWWDKGGVQLPSEYRMHDLSDAFAIMGVSSRPKMVTDFNPNACELRSLDGATVVRVEANHVQVEANTVKVVASQAVIEAAEAALGGSVADGAQAAILGETYLQAEDALFAALSLFMATIETSHNGVSTLPQVAGAINSIGTPSGPTGVAGAVIAAISVFRGASASYRAQRAKVY